MIFCLLLRKKAKRLSSDASYQPLCSLLNRVITVLACTRFIVSEIHRSKISLHRAKKGYDYPTVRLPHQLSVLAGLPIYIYQTTHKGAFAFLVVITQTNASNDAAAECENDAERSKTSFLTRRSWMMLLIAVRVQLPRFRRTCVRVMRY